MQAIGLHSGSVRFYHGDLSTPELSHFDKKKKTSYMYRKWLNFTHFGTEGETIAQFRSASSRSWSRNDQGGWFGSGGGGRGMIWP